MLQPGLSTSDGHPGNKKNLGQDSEGWQKHVMIESPGDVLYSDDVRFVDGGKRQALSVLLRRVDWNTSVGLFTYHWKHIVPRMFPAMEEPPSLELYITGV